MCGSVLTKFGLKRRHLDLIHAIFGVFDANPRIQNPEIEFLKPRWGKPFPLADKSPWCRALALKWASAAWKSRKQKPLLGPPQRGIAILRGCCHSNSSLKENRQK